MCFFGPLKLVLFLEEVEERDPLTLSQEMNLLKEAIHPF
jgi:hypothetical protein